jgi:hypothetical protein
MFLWPWKNGIEKKIVKKFEANNKLKVVKFIVE